jgi:aminoacrylate hydrolase
MAMRPETSEPSRKIKKAMPQIDVADGTLAYEVAGRGEPLLFIAGLGGLGNFWQAQIERFVPHFTVITFDHRGVGKSTGAPPYSMQQWAGDSFALLDHLGIEQAHFIGHSTGGVIAQIAASERPDRVLSAVFGGTWAARDERFRRVFELRRDVLAMLGAEMYSLLGVLLMAPADEPLGPIPQLAAGPKVLAARIDVLLSYEGAERLRRIRCPSLVLAAADDVLIPPHMSRVVAEGIAGAELRIMPDGGHAFPRSRPAEFNRIVLEFLQRNAAYAEGARL